MPRGSDPGQPPVTLDEAWRKLNNLVEKYDKSLCESYREQIDTLLVFAGLFSAVVTAFAVESYQWLQEDPAERSAELLGQAVQLLSSLANQSIPTAPPRGSSLPDSATVRINVYWYMSLVLSLSAALVSILCKQWLREYERDIGHSAEQSLGVRQVKFEGLEYWRVGAIVNSIPLLLQVALALFLIGICELLWNVHRAVAIAATGLTIATGAFYVTTALAPIVQYLYLSILSRVRRNLKEYRYTKDYSYYAPGCAFTAPQCPYKSPQAWLVVRL
ncbi:hypothetical protein EXIGLDRAFT_671188, partial [Exidia glandulosa HHB12029]